MGELSPVECVQGHSALLSLECHLHKAVHLVFRWRRIMA